MRTLTILSFLLSFCLSVFSQETSHSYILFKNVNIFDGVSEKLIEGKDVLIEYNLIKTISSKIKIPEGTVVIDGNGMTLMPGLIEGHGHF